MVSEPQGRFVLARCRNGCCQKVYIPGSRETLRISASVGRGGANRREDVRRIQEAFRGWQHTCFSEQRLVKQHHVDDYNYYHDHNHNHNNHP